MPTPTPVPATTPAPVVAIAGVQTTGDVVVTASVSDSQPEKRSKVTVSARLTSGGQPVADVPMQVTWHYKTTSPSCTGTTDAAGNASCTRNIGGATTGYPVRLTVAFTWNGQTYTGETSFTPR
jgi:hypothetical protein